MESITYGPHKFQSDYPPSVQIKLVTDTRLKKKNAVVKLKIIPKKKNFSSLYSR
jgi:hypothetical protein